MSNARRITQSLPSQMATLQTPYTEMETGDLGTPAPFNRIGSQ
ncbi:hypothetical protein HMPREF0573_10803 [Mobiluncus curtisii ATCC 43063]|uniref:Uncharacterized protein n=1 Tax=Mobiluncus curtisii (strain ATCC 43063 / DSM 2711 / V125) TaxID=548479 RepID=D6ZK73_MOBCV|nr:hypothetical protein HMPREF0573_10803 [Mobiluncus curtisii ATCC 43063]